MAPGDTPDEGEARRADSDGQDAESADPADDAAAAAEHDAKLRAFAAATGVPEILRQFTSGGEPPATDDVDAEDE
jgi:hypothetical protein